MEVKAKASVAYPHSTDANARQELAQRLREVADCYGRFAEVAMSRGDRYSVYDLVKREREMHERARKCEMGFSRF